MRQGSVRAKVGNSYQNASCSTSSIGARSHAMLPLRPAQLTCCWVHAWQASVCGHCRGVPCLTNCPNKTLLPASPASLLPLLGHCSPRQAAASRPLRPKKAPAAATPSRPIPGTLKANSSTSGMPPGASGRGTSLTAGALKSRPLLKPAMEAPAPPPPPLLWAEGGGRGPPGGARAAACAALQGGEHAGGARV